MGPLGNRKARSSGVSHSKKVRVVKKLSQCSGSICQDISSCWLFLPVHGNAKDPEKAVDMFVSSPFEFIQS